MLGCLSHLKIRSEVLHLLIMELVLVLESPLKRLFFNGNIYEKSLDAYEVVLQLSLLALKYFQMCLSLEEMFFVTGIGCMAS